MPPGYRPPTEQGATPQVSDTSVAVLTTQMGRHECHELLPPHEYFSVVILVVETQQTHKCRCKENAFQVEDPLRDHVHVHFMKEKKCSFTPESDSVLPVDLMCTCMCF